MKNRQHNGQKMKDRQHNGQKMKDRQHNGQKKRDNRTNNDLQNITHKTKGKDRDISVVICDTDIQ